MLSFFPSIPHLCYRIERWTKDSMVYTSNLLFKGHFKNIIEVILPERLKNFWFLLALLTSNCSCIIVLLNPRVSFSPLKNNYNQVEKTQVGFHKASMNRHMFSLSCSSGSITRMDLTQQSRQILSLVKTPGLIIKPTYQY